MPILRDKPESRWKTSCKSLTSYKSWFRLYCKSKKKPSFGSTNTPKRGFKYIAITIIKNSMYIFGKNNSVKIFLSDRKKMW